MTYPTIPLLLRVFVAAGTCLQSRCLAQKGGIHITEPLPSNDKRDTHTDRLMGGIYEVRRREGSVAMIYAPSFITIGSGIKKLIDAMCRHIDSTMIGE
jgi:hypothetical protein